VHRGLPGRRRGLEQSRTYLQMIANVVDIILETLGNALTLYLFIDVFI
jgi:hypothetical protein